MEIMFETVRCPYLTPALRETQTQEVTQEIRISDGQPDINRVIGAWGQVILRSKEWQGGSLTLTGGVMAWVLYTSGEEQGEQILEEWLPFRMKWELPEGTGEGTMRAQCLLRFADARNVSPRKLMVRCGVSVMLEAMTPATAEIPRPVAEEKSLQLLKHSYPVLLPKEAGEKSFTIEEELTLSVPCPPDAKLLCCTLRPAVTEAKVVLDKVVFRGNGQAHCLYAGENGVLHAQDFELPFSQFVRLEGEYPADAQADVILAVTNLEASFTEAGTLQLKCGLTGQYLVDERRILEVVEDAYDLDRVLTQEQEELTLPSVLETREEPVTAEKDLPLDAEKILDCVFYPDFPESRKHEQGVRILLTGQFQLLYRQTDGSLQCAAARWEETMDFPGDRENRLFARCLPGGPATAVRRDDGAALSAQTGLCLRTLAGQGISVTTRIELGAPIQRDPGRPSLILRRVGNNSLWSLAKAYGTTEAGICRENPPEELQTPGRMLLIPIP